MQEIFEENRFKSLCGAIVWTPMIAGDSREAASQWDARFSDPRVKQFWDPDKIAGKRLASTLGLTAPIAWDVYLVYPPDHAWKPESPPAPEFWMHQLDEEPQRLLDPLRLRHYVQSLLAQD